MVFKAMLASRKPRKSGLKSLIGQIEGGRKRIQAIYGLKLGKTSFYPLIAESQKPRESCNHANDFITCKQLA